MAEHNVKSSVESNLSEIGETASRTTFSHREVGLNHPDNQSFLRLTDGGDIEIFAVPGVGIVINGSTKTISFFAENIKFYTKEDGLKWNLMDFNHSATTYTEPTFVNSDLKSSNPAYLNLDYYINNLEELEQEESQQTVTIDSDYSYRNITIDGVSSSNLDIENPILSNFTKKEIDSVQIFWNKNNENIKKIYGSDFKNFIDILNENQIAGYTLDQNLAKILIDTKEQ